MSTTEIAPSPVEGPSSGPATLRELVVCSLEGWDDVWRRNQFFTDELLRRNSGLRVLFVEPPSDALFELGQLRRPVRPRISALRDDGRLSALRPLKLLPRRLGSLSDRLLQRQVTFAVRRLGFARPALWVNDVTYAPLIGGTGWPTVYDITDDWLLAPHPKREIARLRTLDRIALGHAHEVVVCSPALATSRGKERDVTLVPNGVDIGHFRRPRQRPTDLPTGPTAVYVGTLHDARLDSELVIELARALPALTIALVGPNSLERPAQDRLSAESNVHILGSRPYAEVPAYLQHADVVLVPHRVTPFTESLDPIKAYECLAVGRPTVATPVAGFRELSRSITVVPPEAFVNGVRAALGSKETSPNPAVPSWDDRVEVFEALLARAAFSADTPAPTR